MPSQRFFRDHWDILHAALTHFRNSSTDEATKRECDACLEAYREIAAPIIRAESQKALDEERNAEFLANLIAELRNDRW